MQLNIIREVGVSEFALQNFHGEWRCIDRATQAVPKVLHRAQVIFVCMREYKSGKLIFAFLDESWVWRDQINPRRASITKGDAEINHQPCWFFGFPVTIQVQVHANFAGTAQR